VNNEKMLRESMDNKELVRMLGFEKSLIYFSTSLRGMEATITKIGSGRVVKLYEDDKDLLDDVLIEIRQAIEMCSIEQKILSSSMDTFGSLISNNLNTTMKTLTIITLVLAIPTIVFSFYGMNVEGLPFIFTSLFPFLVAAILSVIAAFVLQKGPWFK
jgi:magnesium transporter